MLFQSPRLRLQCADQVATLWLDAHVLNWALLQDLNRAAGIVQRSPLIDVLVIRTGQPGAFLSGPDLEEYDALTDAPSRRAFARAGHALFQRLRDLSADCPSIAYIEGDCRDAGLELALACDYRLAVAAPETRLGFDYAVSGLLPCWGATQRLPQLLGPRTAVEMLTDGKLLPARAAKQIGLVDHAFGPRPAKTEFWWFVAEVQDRQRWPRRRNWWSRLSDVRSDARIFQPALSALPKGSHLRPLVEALRRGWGVGPAEGFAAERAAFAAHAHDPASEELREAARRRAERSRIWRDVPAPMHVGISCVDHLGIELAIAALAAGGFVSIPSQEGLHSVRAALTRAVDRGWFNFMEAEQALKRVSVAAWAECEIVFVPRGDSALVRDLDRQLPAGAVIAAESPAAGVCPERVVGFDFAASRIVPTRGSEERAVAVLFRWLERCGRPASVAEQVETAAEPVAA